MRHCHIWCRAMPMPLVRCKPDDVSRTDFFNRPTFALYPAETGGDDQRLTQRMNMPCGASTWVKCYGCPTNPRRLRRFEQRFDTDHACKPVGWPFCETMRTGFFDFQV